MFTITGRLITIINETEKSSKVILKKQVHGKVVALAFPIFGTPKFRMEDLKLQKNEKVSLEFYLKSEIWQGKWKTQVCAKTIQRYIPKPKWDGTQYVKQDAPMPEERLFNDEDSFIDDERNFIVDEETGEIRL